MPMPAGIGTVGAARRPGRASSTRMAYVFGTSACTMTTTERARLRAGRLGSLFLGDGARASGSTKAASPPPAPRSTTSCACILQPDEAARVGQRAGRQPSAPGWPSSASERRRRRQRSSGWSGDLHVVPEFLGNRAPFADPDAQALIAGIGMDTGIDSLVGLYLAGLCGLGYGARQIIEAQRAVGIPTDTIVISGGAGQSPLVRQVLADATGLTVAASTSPEPVLLGSAILGAVAAGHYPDISMAMSAMSELGDIHQSRPRRSALAQQALGRIREVARDRPGNWWRSSVRKPVALAHRRQNGIPQQNLSGHL